MEFGKAMLGPRVYVQRRSRRMFRWAHGANSSPVDLVSLPLILSLASNSSGDSTDVQGKTTSRRRCLYGVVRLCRDETMVKPPA